MNMGIHRCMWHTCVNFHNHRSQYSMYGVYIFERQNFWSSFLMAIFCYETCAGGSHQYKLNTYLRNISIFRLYFLGLKMNSKFEYFRHKFFYRTLCFIKLVEFFRLRRFYSKRKKK
jgi:hypothetical protein